MHIGYFIDAKKARGRRTFKGVKFSRAITGLYYTALREIVESVYKYFEDTVIKGLDSKVMGEKIQTAIFDESPNERYKKKLAAFNKKLRGKYSRQFIEKLVRKFIERAEKYSRSGFKRELKSFGLDISQDLDFKKYSSYTATCVEENIMLVSNLIDEQAKRLKSSVLRAIREGVPVRKLAGDLQKDLGISKRRALLIARTETHKVTQQIADMRARDLGCKYGVWRAVMDERTSAQHARFNLKRFDLKKGLYDPKTNSRNWPGRRPNCRCHTDYEIPGLDE